MHRPDSLGNIVPQADDSVRIVASRYGAVGNQWIGPVTTRASGGVATFDGLVLTRADTYRITAHAAGVGLATTVEWINIYPGRSDSIGGLAVLLPISLSEYCLPLPGLFHLEFLMAGFVVPTVDLSIIPRT